MWVFNIKKNSRKSLFKACFIDKICPEFTLKPVVQLLTSLFVNSYLPHDSIISKQNTIYYACFLPVFLLRSIFSIL